jgi:hypothetical protein
MMLAQQNNTTMNTTETKIKAAKELTYRVSTDELFADGEHVGGASDFSRELMQSMVDETNRDDDEETLFDALVTTI